ncbi:IclR family transcriptional regulator [Betaproteobacteria bacterium LSUCC0117]|nr:IclR family transcriptional regulator [Betaproteobacteria bacterium LSUCC0117]
MKTQNKPNTQSVVAPNVTALDNDKPTMRQFALLEALAKMDRFATLQTLVEETGLPKPTVHRMLQQLEMAGMVQRDGDGRQYTTGLRLRQLAETVLLNNTVHGARHLVLRRLVEEVGETCNLTAFNGSEVVYLDRVETPAPLRFYLQAGSVVPAHCSATGKLFLAQMTPSQRRRLLGQVSLERFTPKTITDMDAIEAEIAIVKRDGVGYDREEYLPGLICVAVLVPSTNRTSNLGLAIQAPSMRLTPQRVEAAIPALQRAASALQTIEEQAASGPDLNNLSA